MHYELFETMPEAIARERRRKGWHRAWKLELIESGNPDCRALWGDYVAGD